MDMVKTKAIEIKPSLKSQSGQAVVEMAFVLLIFLFVIFGITEFARALYTYNTIVQSTRAAARWGVVNVAGNSDTINIDKAKNIVVYGNADTPSSSPLLAGLTKDEVRVLVLTIEADSVGTPISRKISVTVSGYQFKFIVPLVPDLSIPPFETSLYTESMGSTG